MLWTQTVAQPWELAGLPSIVESGWSHLVTSIMHHNSKYTENSPPTTSLCISVSQVPNMWNLALPDASNTSPGHKSKVYSMSWHAKIPILTSNVSILWSYFTVWREYNYSLVTSLMVANYHFTFLTQDIITYIIMYLYQKYFNIQSTPRLFMYKLCLEKLRTTLLQNLISLHILNISLRLNDYINTSGLSHIQQH